MKVMRTACVLLTTASAGCRATDLSTGVGFERNRLVEVAATRDSLPTEGPVNSRRDPFLGTGH